MVNWVINGVTGSFIAVSPQQAQRRASEEELRVQLSVPGDTVVINNTAGGGWGPPRYERIPPGLGEYQEPSRPPLPPVPPVPGEGGGREGRMWREREGGKGVREGEMEEGWRERGRDGEGGREGENGGRERR